MSSVRDSQIERCLSEIMKSQLRTIHWFLSSQLGLDMPRLFRAICVIPSFLLDCTRFARRSKWKMELRPCFHDRSSEAGDVGSEYFLQDLHVASAIFRADPARHLDIGSRVDGFVAHVASFREISVVDVRPITSAIPNIVFRQADLSDDSCLEALGKGDWDSVSCLHALEHFGLGRYGDPIDPDAYVQGLENMASLLKPGGVLYLSTPVGRQRVQFNANRIFDPRTILVQANKMGLTVQSLVTIRGGRMSDLGGVSLAELAEIALWDYGLGIFVFCKDGRCDQP
jgi:hypothetical protein